MSLQEKINKSREIMSRALAYADPDQVYVAWTGGKDSTAALYLWAGFLEENGYNGKLRAISLDTGLKFPEILEFRDYLAEKWGVDLHVVKPDVDISGYPAAIDKLSCCRDLKIRPLKKAVKELVIRVLIVGIRRDEHPERENRKTVEKESAPEYFRLNPILHWTEMDIWSFIIRENLPYCELYDKGYSSLGCMPCTNRSAGSGERSGRNEEKEKNMAMLRSLGYF